MESSDMENDFEKLPPSDDFGVSSSTLEHHHGIEDVPSHPVPETPTEKRVSGESGEHAVGAKSPQASSCPAEASCCHLSAMVKNVNPKVADLVMWRCPKKTGIVFGTLVVLLLALSLCSILSVVAYFGLVVLMITTSYRLYCNVMAMMNKSTECCAPFKKCLETDLTISEETIRRCADCTAKQLTKTAATLRRLFLVENIVDSLKFGLVLWLLTYVGSWFNGLTLVLIGVVELFTIPKVYEMHKEKIDQHLHKACIKAKEVWTKVEGKLPPVVANIVKKKQA